MFEVYLHGDWSKVDSKIGINIKNAWSRESKSHGECELIVLSKTVYVEWDHLIHRKRSPFPYEGKALTPLKLGRGFPYRARHFHLAASEALPRSRRGEAHRRRGGGLEGFTPPHNLRRGQRLPTDSVHTPAPRVSAGLRFAVIPLS